MTTGNRLDGLYASARRIEMGAETKLVMVSDVHRGDGSMADTFAKNQTIYSAALSHYAKNGYTYVELGDGDELWENRHASNIISAHKDVFWQLLQLHRARRLIMLYGNHDIIKRDPAYMRRHFGCYTDPRTKQHVKLLGDMPVYESVVLCGNGGDILLIHGHQADPLNCRFWRLARFLVRYLWRPIEIFGANDPTSAAKNYRRKEKTERTLTRWVQDKNILLIAGHTHRPMLPLPGGSRYINDGSAVHPRCMTAIEIDSNTISLVKWSVKTRQDSVLYVGRDVLAGPYHISEYFLS
jgi:UDP-2,3-diacylglucosamine pyrophosphatase LpxH